MCSCLENPRDSRAWWAAVYGVAQSRTRLKWLSSSSAVLSPAWLFETPWFADCQALLPMEFSRQEHWSGLLFPSLGDHPDPGMEFGLLRLLDWQVNLFLLHHQLYPGFTQNKRIIGGKPAVQESPSWYLATKQRNWDLETAMIVSISFSLSS